jgi:catechol 2,3-dioxygenase-like lactoylglutathione lyase family enzyme
MGIIQGLTKVILYIQDMNKQVRFYRDVLDLTVKYPAGLDSYSNEPWVELETGECILVLYVRREKRLGEDRPKLAFRVNDIEAAHKTLTERGALLSDIASRSLGLKIADGFDPEGNPFAIECHSHFL